MKPITVTLPHPPEQLHPNARCHWRAKLGPKARIRDTAFALARSEGVDLSGVERVKMDAYWYHPQKRFSPHDDDNLTAWLKSARDGLALGFWMDDKRIRMGEHFQAKDADNPRVVIVIAALDNEGAA